MNIQIFCEQSAKFVHPLDKRITHEVRCFDFATAPEWVVDTLLWKLLEKDGKVKMIKSSADAIEVGKNEGKLAKEAARVTEIVESDDIALDEYSKMKTKELYDLCVEQGIEVEEKKPKSYYIEKLTK